MSETPSAFRQGKFDGLCGVYSIINANRKVNGFSEEKCQELFGEVVQFLDREKSLSKVLITGIDITIIGQILNNVSSLSLEKQQPYHGKKDIPLGAFWKGMQQFMSEPNRAIVIGLYGYHDHWTVVNSISEKQIQYLDSDGIKRLNRPTCTVGDPSESRKNQIYPGYAYFLSKGGK